MGSMGLAAPRSWRSAVSGAQSHCVVAGAGRRALKDECRASVTYATARGHARAARRSRRNSRREAEETGAAGLRTCRAWLCEYVKYSHRGVGHRGGHGARDTSCQYTQLVGRIVYRQVGFLHIRFQNANHERHIECTELTIRCGRDGHCWRAHNGRRLAAAQG